MAYAWGDAFVGAGDNILVSEMEHHSNIVPWQLLARRKGAEIRVLPFDDAGALRTELLPELVDERTRVVAVTQASNTLGGPTCGPLSKRRMPSGPSSSWTAVRAWSTAG